MKKNATTAKGGAMPVTRRRFLAAAPAAVAVMALPVAAVAAVPEAHSTEALRHAEALAAVMARPDFLPGDWSCTVKSGNADQPIFFKQDFQPTGRPSREVVALIEAHRKAWDVFEGSCNFADSLHPSYAGQKAERLRDRLDRAERKALNALLAYAPDNLPDHRARAKYLLNGHADLEGHEGAIRTLLRSFIA